MDLQLGGRRALVVGGGSGLGNAVATALAGEGVSVALLSRERAKLESAAASIVQGGGRAIAVTADLADFPSVSAAVDEAEAVLGGNIEILLNNSGGPPPSSVIGVDPDSWRAHFDTMILSYIQLAERVLPAMRAAQWGRVLNVASSSVVMPIAGLGMSNTLRASVVGWAKTLADEIGRDGVTVNTLLPGRISTDRINTLDSARAASRGQDVAAVRETQDAQIPVGRAGKPEEFGAIAAFLASPLAAYITGSAIRIDGGAIRSV